MRNLTFYILIICGALILTCSDNPVENNIELYKVSGFVYRPFFDSHLRTENVIVKFNEYETVSDSGGAYSIRVPEGDYEPICIHPNGDTLFNPKIKINYNREIDLFVNSPQADFFGYVRNQDSEPMDSVLVSINYLSTFTDQNGFYQFSNIPEGDYTVSFEKYRFDTLIDTVSLDHDDFELEINLNQILFRLSGFVYGRDSIPLESVLITANELETYSDQSGYFEFDEIPVGENNLVFERDTYNTLNSNIIIDNDINENFYLLMLDYSLSGNISHNIEGNVSSAIINLDSVYFDTTDIYGNYSFSNLEPKEYNLYIEHSEYLIYDTTVDIPPNSVENNANFRIYKPVVNSYPISEDSYISYYTDDMTSVTTNSGLDTLFRTSYYYAYYGMASWVERFDIVYLKFPDIALDNIDSVVIEFTNLYPDLDLTAPDSIVAIKIINDWSESTIVWDNQPGIEQSSLNIKCVRTPDSKVRINIRDNVEYITNEFGLRLSVENNCHSGLCDYSLYLCSNEYAEIEKRPKVIVYSRF